MTYSMPDSPANSPAMLRAKLSMFDVYSGYVVTQGHNALQQVVMWERVMRAIGTVAIVAVAALWLAPDAATGPQVLPLKFVLSAVLAGMAALLFWSARTRPQYETQVDLIRCEVRQVMRAASGIERLMMRIPFDVVGGVNVRENRAMPAVGLLFIVVEGVDTPVLLGVGEVADLAVVRNRLYSDLEKARSLPQTSRPVAAVGRRATGMQAA